MGTHYIRILWILSKSSSPSERVLDPSSRFISIIDLLQYVFFSSTVVISKAVPVAMAGSKSGVACAALVGICVLVVMAAMVAESDAAGACNLNALYPCVRAIQGARPPAPSKQCCNVVRSVDKNCMCNQLKSSSFPAQMVKNGLQLPKKCGRTDLRGFKCGRKCTFEWWLSWLITNYSCILITQHNILEQCWSPTLFTAVALLTTLAYN